MRILLIEDDERLGPLVVRLLSAERHTVQLAATGADGVAFWESQEWDLVILDRDILTCAEDDIARIKPVATYVEGRKVYPLASGR